MVSVMLYFCILCVVLCAACLTVFVNCLVKQFAMCLGVVAILLLNVKPGKGTSIPKSYRPILLLCHTYKMYERLILNRITSTVESHLIKEQAGFRLGKSCTSQHLNLTQHIEDGYQNRMITGAAFVDLSAAYDTVNHRILIQKIFNTTRVSPLCRVIQNMLSSRRFYIELNNERSRWKKPEERLAQVFYHQYCLTYIQTTSLSTLERGVSSMLTTFVSQPSIHPSQR